MAHFKNSLDGKSNSLSSLIKAMRRPSFLRKADNVWRNVYQFETQNYDRNVTITHALFLLYLSLSPKASYFNTLLQIYELSVWLT